MSYSPLMFRYPCAPTPVKAALRDDVQQSVARSIQRLPLLGVANPEGALQIGRHIDNWMPDPDDGGLEDDAPDVADARGPVGVVARSTVSQHEDLPALKRRVADLRVVVRSTRCSAAQQDRVRDLLDGLQVGVLREGDDAAAITTHYSRLVMDTLFGVVAVTDRKGRARRAHQLSREAQRRSATAKAYSAAARQRLARSA